MPSAPVPYRTAPDGPKAVEGPREFVYAIRQRGDDVRALFPVLFLLGLACVVLASYGYRIAALGLFVGAAAGGWRLRSRRSSGVVVRVENGMLLVYPWRGGKTATVVALDELLDVRLDSKTIQKTQRETRAGVYAATGPTTSLEVDVARIALVLSPKVPPIELTSSYAPHSQTVVQIAKMKTFLRSRGWLPEDEREAESGG